MFRFKNVRVLLGAFQVLNGVLGAVFVLVFVASSPSPVKVGALAVFPFLLAVLMLILGVYILKASVAAGWGSVCIHVAQLLQFSGEPLEFSFDAGLKYVVWYSFGEGGRQLVGLNLVSLALLLLAVRYLSLIRREKGKQVHLR